MKELESRGGALLSGNLIPVFITVCNIITIMLIGDESAFYTLAKPLMWLCAAYIILSGAINLVLIIALTNRIFFNREDGRSKLLPSYVLTLSIIYFIILIFFWIHHFSS
jgi:hypothetical protein